MNRHNILYWVGLFAIIIIMSLSCKTDETAISDNYGNNVARHSTVLAGCNITLTKPYILAFGGCDGWPVYEVQLTFRESQILRKIIMRARQRR